VVMIILFYLINCGHDVVRATNLPLYFFHLALRNYKQWRLHVSYMWL